MKTIINGFAVVMNLDSVALIKRFLFHLKYKYYVYPDVFVYEILNLCIVFYQILSSLVVQVTHIDLNRVSSEKYFSNLYMFLIMMIKI